MRYVNTYTYNISILQVTIPQRNQTKYYVYCWKLEAASQLASSKRWIFILHNLENCHCDTHHRCPSTFFIHQSFVDGGGLNLFPHFLSYTTLILLSKKGSISKITKALARVLTTHKDHNSHKSIHIHIQKDT